MRRLVSVLFQQANPLQLVGACHLVTSVFVHVCMIVFQSIIVEQRSSAGIHQVRAEW